MSSEEAKESKKPRLSKEHEALLKTLDNLGISAVGEDGKDLPYDVLLKKVVAELTKTNDKLASAMANTEADSLNKYSNAVEHNLKNNEFIQRLKIYLLPI